MLPREYMARFSPASGTSLSRPLSVTSQQQFGQCRQEGYLLATFCIIAITSDHHYYWKSARQDFLVFVSVLPSSQDLNA
eukprot:scaffold385424_cov31-Prasinocladus_malaysianus.AAC.1